MNGKPWILSLNVSLSVHRYLEWVVVMIPLIPGHSVAFPKTGPSSCFTKTQHSNQKFSDVPSSLLWPSHSPRQFRQFGKWGLLGLSPGLMSPHDATLGVLQKCCCASGVTQKPPFPLCYWNFPRGHHETRPLSGSSVRHPLASLGLLVPQSWVNHTRGAKGWLSPSFLPHWQVDFHQKNELLLLPYLFSIGIDSQITDLFNIYQCFFRKLMVFRNQDLGSLLLGLWWLRALSGKNLVRQVGVTHAQACTYHSPLGILLQTHTNKLVGDDLNTSVHPPEFSI